MCVKSEIVSVKSAVKAATLFLNPTEESPHCAAPYEVHSCLHNDYYGGQHDLSRLPQVIAIQSGVNLQFPIGSGLNSICGGFGDDLGPLLNRTARVPDRSSDCGSVAIVIRQNITLTHGADGTAC